MKKKIIVFSIALILLISLYYANKIMVVSYPYVREIKEDNLTDNVKDYKTAQSEHFIVRYTPPDEKYVPLVLKIAEKHYDSVTKDLGHKPVGKIVIIMYHDPEKMNRDFSLAKGDTAMGIYLNGIISIASPELWISPTKDLEKVFEHEGPIVHEFAHLIVDDVAKGNYPVWFTEGIALLEEYRENGFVWGEYITTDKPYSLKELTYNFNQLDETLAYKRSFEIVKAITDKYEMQSIREILKYLGEGLNLSESFYKVTGQNLEKFVDSVK
ncbi:peptidase MA family metallohydrolase [Thermoanaerobacter mathranii]|uniref:peptidase MA family metallohydrolase n=1 Tax=Thermoanaerobacter mathranii TaxID=583357 RepID=UPI003AAECF0C